MTRKPTTPALLATATTCLLAHTAAAAASAAQNQTLPASSMTSENVNVTFANSPKLNFAQTIPFHTKEGYASTALTYKAVKTYDYTNFFTEFAFYSGVDPTHGYVDYQTYEEAISSGLAYVTGSNQIYMGVDSSTVNPVDGRKSVRISSNTAFNHGLFIADIVHMPGNICGAWPAYWMFGPNWPNSGEVDILEGVGTQAFDEITLHTSAGCNIDVSGSDAGTALIQTTDCQSNQGCPVSTTVGQAYGDSFNTNGGGVYAMQWESSGMYVWFWTHANVPADITSGTPDTTNWGTPVVAFNGGSGCNIDTFFANMNIVVDTTFCGDWAGSEGSWSATGCSAMAGTCLEYVANNPAAFASAFWLFNSITVYQQSY